MRTHATRGLWLLSIIGQVACTGDSASVSESDSATFGSTGTAADTETGGPCSKEVFGDLAINNAADAENGVDVSIVHGSLRVTFSDDITDLEFLRCLERVDERVTVSDNSSLLSTSGLANLAWARKVEISRNPALVDIRLERVAELEELSIDKNDKLSLISFESLQMVGWFWLGSCTSIPSARHYNLVDLGGMPALEYVEWLWVDGNESLVSVSLLDDLANSPVKPSIDDAVFRLNPGLPDGVVSSQLDMLGVESRYFCENLESSELMCQCL